MGKLGCVYAALTFTTVLLDELVVSTLTSVSGAFTATPTLPPLVVFTPTLRAIAAHGVVVGQWQYCHSVAVTASITGKACGRSAVVP